MFRTYYNEHDPRAAEWLRELIKAGLISDGDVDERSIEDILPSDLKGYTRCHFFAGIGIWDYALGLAGWPDDREVWTGSCPCQPFSAAGKREGFADERHLWPAFFHLINECRPRTIFGEQVASKDGRTWLDLVHSDLEGAGFAVGACDFPAASVGAPHRRQRLYFVADTKHARHHRSAGVAPVTNSDEPGQRLSNGNCPVVSLALTNGGNASAERELGSGEQRQQSKGGGVSRMANSDIRGFDGQQSAAIERASANTITIEAASSGGVALGDTEQQGLQGYAGNERNGNEPGRIGENAIRPITETGPTNGFWSDAEWLYCRDGKYRPTKPGLFPLANGIAGRVGLLRGYGNAIVSEQAKAFIESFLETEES